MKTRQLFGRGRVQLYIHFPKALKKSLRTCLTEHFKYEILDLLPFICREKLLKLDSVSSLKILICSPHTEETVQGVPPTAKYYQKCGKAPKTSEPTSGITNTSEATQFQSFLTRCSARCRQRIFSVLHMFL